MTTKKILSSVAVFCWLAMAASAQSQVLAQHSGAVNPATEGFALLSYGSPQLGPVINDVGVNAWSIRMLHSDAAHYTRTLSPGQYDQLAGADWQLTYTLRILQAPAIPSYDISSSFYTGKQMFSLYFGAAPNGDPIVQVRENSLLLSPAITLSGAGATYNTFSIKYQAASDSADLWVNGTEVYSDMKAAPFIGSQATLKWSGYQHGSDVEANWSLVSLAIVPEPSVASLTLLGILAAFCRRSRQRG